MKNFFLVLTLCVLFNCAYGQDKRLKDISLQLYSLRDDINKDYANVIKEVGKMGYTSVETANYDAGKRTFYGRTPADFKKDLEDAGLTMLSAHTFIGMSDEVKKSKNFELMSEQWDKCIDDHKAAGAKYIVCAGVWIPNTIDELQTICDYFNYIGKKCTEKGLTFGYHNHDYEFRKVEDKAVMIDYMIENTNPAYVTFEMDTYWVVKGGKAPVDYFKKYPGRFALLHVKDHKELGESGMVGFDAIFKNMDIAGVKHLVVEVEEYDHTPLESVKLSLDYLLNFPLAKKIKIACVGNSLTGFHQYNYYATPLQQMLGNAYLIDNFGKGGSGVFKGFREELDEHDWAYINSGQCKEALAFLPDIVIIKFGANDANMKNFTKEGIDGKKVFKDDYTLLINAFRELPTKPKVYISIPPAMFYGEEGFFGGFSNQAVREYIQPAVKELAQELNVGLIDFYTPTKDHPEFMPGESPGQFPDWVHPDHRGHYVMALETYKAIKGKEFERPVVAGEFIPDPNKAYYIKNKKTGHVLDCKITDDKETISLVPMKKGDEAQLFRFENFSYDTYRVRNAGSEFLLKSYFNIRPGKDNSHLVYCDNEVMSIAGAESNYWEFVESEK